MADTLQVEKGARPWAPARDVTVGEVLHRHDIPLVGLLEQSRLTYLYVCLLGETDSTNVWAYARLELDEYKDLMRTDGDDFDKVVAKVLSDRPLTMAIALDWEIEDWSVLDAGQEGFVTTADRFLRRMMRRWERAHARADQLEKSELIGC